MRLSGLVFSLMLACSAPSSVQILELDGSPSVRAQAQLVEVLVLRDPGEQVLLREVRAVPRDGEFPFVYSLARAGTSTESWTLIARAYATEDTSDEPIARTTLIHGGWSNETVRLLLTTDPEVGMQSADGGF